jgi:hypothetical protein
MRPPFRHQIPGGRGSGCGWLICAALGAAAAAGAALPSPAGAAETISYAYDARGRLVEVKRVVNGATPVVTAYAFDKADNRLSKATTGSPNPPPP